MEGKKKKKKTQCPYFLVRHNEACFAATEGTKFLASPLVCHGEARFAAAKLGPKFLVHNSEVTFFAVRLSPSPQQRALRRSKGSFTAAKRLVFQASINTRDGHFFPLNVFWCAPFVSYFFLCAFFFSDFKPSVTTMALKKTVPAKRHRSSSTSWAVPPPPDDPRRFISWEAERLYHESLCIHSFVQGLGFPTSNPFFNFTI